MKKEKLIRFLNNLSTPKEGKEVREWLDRPDSEKELERILSEHWEKEDRITFDNVGQYKQLFKKIETAALGKKKVKTSFSREFGSLVRIAASVSLLLFSAYFLVKSWNIETVDDTTESMTPQLISRTTGAGEKLRITLPDQSKVIVNSLSEISFTSEFGNMDRVIQLDGEAYFEVFPDKDRPFKVKTGTVITTALGTAFNAYSREDGVEVSLTEGSVLVSYEAKEVQLSPGERAAVKDEINVGNFEEELVTAWKEGKITFRGKRMEDIMLSLEKWYGAEINIDNSINKGRTVSGTFNNESLEDILNGLSFSIGFDFTINGKTVNIKP